VKAGITREHLTMLSKALRKSPFEQVGINFFQFKKDDLVLKTGSTSPNTWE
jgi:hypothetical protein